MSQPSLPVRRVMWSCLWTLLVASCLGAAADDGATVNLREPVLRLPPAQAAPSIDGEIGAQEWAGAWMMEGSVGHADQALEQRPAWAYLTYDRENLYVAIKSATRPGGKLHIWEHDPDEAILGMDGIEVWIAELYDPAQPPIDRFQLWYDPYGTQWALIHRYGAGFNVQEKLPVGTRIIGDEWHFELAFPWRLAGLKPGDIKDGKQVLVRPCRNWRYNGLYSTWGGEGAFYLKDNMMRVILDSKAPVVRIPSLGDWFGGKADIQVEVVNATGEPVEVAAELTVGSYENAAAYQQKGPGESVATDKKTLQVPPGQTASSTISAAFEAVPLLPAKLMSSQRRNCHYSVEINVTRVSDGALLFSRFMKVPGTRQKLWGDLPSRAAKLQGGYYPYFSKIKASLSLGDDPRAAEVTHATVTVHPEEGTAPVGRGDIVSFPYGTGETTIDVGDLAEGAYVLRAAIYAGETQLDFEKPVERSFTREKMPWEHNSIGITDKVYPPFTPIEVKGNRVGCVLRDHTMHGLGLWNQVEAKGRPILAAPMRLECRAAGRQLEWKVAESPVFGRKAGHEVQLKGNGACDALSVTTDCLWEYDGMMKVVMNVVPRGETQVDELELVIPVRADIATLMHSTTATRSNPSMAIPQGDGVVWDSRSMAQSIGKGTFTPYVWIGGVERGVCWFADNDKGWVTDDKEPAIEIERTGDTVNLRVRFINRAGIVNAPRQIVFGLMATPVKPIPAESRAWWHSWRGGQESPRRYSTSLSSYRFAGFSDRETLTPLGGDFSIFAYFAERQGTGGSPTEAEEEYIRNWMQKYVEDPTKGGLLAQLVKTFASTKASEEAVYYTNPALETAGTPQGRQFQNEWKNGISSMGCNFVKSYNDYAAWCYDQMLATGLKCGIYHDNTFPVASTDVIAGSAYVREDGRIQAGWNVFGHREFYKRLFVTGWERMGRMPLIYPHTTNGMTIPQFAFATIHLALEWEQKSLRTFQEKFQFPLLRTEVMGKQAGLIPRILCSMGEPTMERTEEARTERALLNGYLHRTREGVLLLHDSFPRGHGTYMGDIVRFLMPYGFHEEPCEYIGYWEEPQLVKAPDGTAVSLFKMEKGVLAVVVDTSGKDGRRRIEVDEKALGRPVKKLTDFERWCFEQCSSKDGPNYHRAFDEGSTAYGSTWPYYYLDNGFTNTARNAIEVNIRKHDYCLLLIEFTREP